MAILLRPLLDQIILRLAAGGWSFLLLSKMADFWARKKKTKKIFKKGLHFTKSGVIIAKQSNGARGSSSVVECHLAKVDVASSNLVYRSI